MQDPIERKDENFLAAVRAGSLRRVVAALKQHPHLNAQDSEHHSVKEIIAAAKEEIAHEKWVPQVWKNWRIKIYNNISHLVEDEVENEKAANKANFETIYAKCRQSNFAQADGEALTTFVKEVSVNPETSPVHAKVNTTWDLFVLAMSKGRSDIGILLIENGLDAYDVNEDENTPLHLAAAFGQMDMVKYLVEEKTARIDVQNKKRHTPMDDAKEGKHDEVVQYLEHRLDQQMRAC